MILATVEDAKKITTYDHNHDENGFLIELYKDGDTTTAYLTAAKPGAIKEYNHHISKQMAYTLESGVVK